MQKIPAGLPDTDGLTPCRQMDGALLRIMSMLAARAQAGIKRGGQHEVDLIAVCHSAPEVQADGKLAAGKRSGAT